MSLTTLLEAAKYLDYLDSSQNNNQKQKQNQNIPLNSQQDQQEQQQQRHHHHTNIYQQNELSQATAQGQSAGSSGTTNHRPIKKSPSSSGRARARRLTGSSRKQQHGTNDMIAMSLPASATLGPSSGLHQLASCSGSSAFMMMATSKSPPPSAGLLSSSYTGAGSSQSSPTSIALLSSKTSGVTSNISSAASSLTSSDTSSSCGEILMSELDFNQCTTSVGSNYSVGRTSHNKTSTNHHDYHKKQPMHQQPHLSHTNNNDIELLSNIQQPNNNNNNNIYTNYNQLTHPFNDANPTTTYYGPGPNSGHSMPQPITGGQNDNGRRLPVRRKTSRSSGAKGLMTLASSAGSYHQHHQTLASTSVPLDGSLHAGRVFHATSVLDACSGQLKITAQPAHQYHPSNRLSGSGLDLAHGSTFISVPPTYFASTSGATNQPSPPIQQSGSLMISRVQPMIFQHNSLAQQASGAKQQQSIMAFQQTTSSLSAAAAPSPTSTSSSYSRHRELHKTLEKNRRAHLRHCFELLKAELPSSECVDRKTSHINIIRSAIRCVLSLIEQGATLELELKGQLDIKNRLTNQLSSLKSNLTSTSSSNQQPVAEQQLSFLLSRSKID